VQRSRRAALAALCVLALALGAATLQNPVADGGGLGDAGSGGFGDGSAEDAGGMSRNGTPNLGDAIGVKNICLPFFTSQTFFRLVLVATLLLGAALYYRDGPILAVAVLGVLYAPGIILWALLTNCNEPSLEAGSPTNFSFFPGENGSIATGLGGGGGPGSSLPSLTTTVLLVLAVAVVLVALVMLRASDDDVQQQEADAEPERSDGPESLAGLAGVAGEAADRIEATGGDTENEVYRAWREMTDRLDVPNPRTSTPAEFRDAARQAGMADEHVAALTDLFRDVRYGGATADAARESRAVEALRAIEDAYGGDDGS